MRDTTPNTGANTIHSTDSVVTSALDENSTR